MVVEGGETGIAAGVDMIFFFFFFLYPVFLFHKRMCLIAYVTALLRAIDYGKRGMKMEKASRGCW